MQGLSIEQNNLYLNNFNDNQKLETSANLPSTQHVEDVKEIRLHNDAVSVSISANNIQSHLQNKSSEFSKGNTNAQQVLNKISNGNNDYSNFFEDTKFENKFSLESIGYEGKAISKLNKEEAKELLGNKSFFGSEETSKRVSEFVKELTGNQPDALEKVKEGLKRGYEEAQKLFNNDVPAVTHDTQKKVFDVIDKKIEEMLKTDLVKELETKHIENNKL